MGVDLTSYRVRIGGFIGRCTSNVNRIPLCKDNPVCVFIGCKGTSCLRTVLFIALVIRLLLILGGIEQNPGPKSKGHLEITESEETHAEQKSKSIGHKVKSFFGFKSDQKPLLQEKERSKFFLDSESTSPKSVQKNKKRESAGKLFGQKCPKKANSQELLYDREASSKEMDDSNDKTITVQSEYTIVGDNSCIIINKEPTKECSANIDLTKHLEETFRENLGLSIQTWLRNASFVGDCPTYLLDLIIEIESSSEKTQFWERCLIDFEPLERFLQKLLDHKTMLETKLPVVKYYLERLIPPYSLNISRTAITVIQWLQSTRIHYVGKSSLTVRHMESVAGFVNQIRKFLNDLQTKLLSQQPNSDLDAYITSELALSVYRLFKTLECTSKWSQSCFLRIELLPLSYRKPSGNFEIQVNYSKLQQFVETIERQMELYNQVSNNEEKLQAFLVDRLLYVIKSQDTGIIGDDEVKGCIFRECLKPIDHLLVARVSNLVSKCAMEVPFAFDTLHKLIKNLFESEPKQNQESFDNLIDVLRIPVDPELQNVTESKIPVSIPTNIENLLIFFKLDLYFPGKICLQELMSFTSFVNKPSDIPWKILQRLILMDYRSRDSILDEFYSSDSFANVDSYDEDERQFEEFLDEFDTEDNGHVSKNIAIQFYNPLDVLTVTFCCCDNYLKQVLFEKMFICKLAVPFIYPCPTSERLLCSFWSLRSINIELESKTLSVMNDHIPRVVFIRMKRPPYSKSKLLNMLVSDVSHDTFLHRDCSKVVTSKIFSEGLIEAFWSIPSRREVSEIIMYLNLRGDAADKKKQLEVLKKIVNVFVVIIDVSKLIDSREVLESLYRPRASVILILTNENGLSKDIPTQYCKFLRSGNLLGRTAFISVSNRGEMKTEIALRADVLSKIKKFLVNKNADSLEEYENVLKELNIINEEQEEGDFSCFLGGEMARQVIPNNVSLFKKKPIMLKLQNKDLWGKLSRLQQNKYNSGEKLSLADRSAIRHEIGETRSIQLQFCKKLSPCMNVFLRTFLDVFDHPNKVLYFCHWLKLIFDAYSRNHLPQLNRDLQQNWEALKLARQADWNGREEEFKQRLLDAERDFCNANFGLEHLFREVGQIYEAIIESNEEITDELKNICENLPKAMAKLVLHGHPLEIMDGDTVAVPIIWIKAVFRHLALFTREKHFLTVGVIGGQSTGKSTLLNSMFGVSFPVKAGRCTRGLFMQLLPRKKTKCKDFDYVLIIDTEGLKLAASVLDKHDLNNKLTTLAIGLADVTIVNVQGEKVDVQEVLQIAVQGFFRLRRVYPRLNLNKHCVFLQQHVEATNAETNLVYERQRFEEELDILTEQAADQENVTNIRTFKQVIDFDSKKHFWYFPGFWYGSPPSAPVNRDYSKKVEEVKTCILEEIPNKICHFHSLNDISIQLEDLWTGILSDNFVYSFRNSKQIRAYKTLTRKLHEVEFKVEDTIYEEEKRFDLLLPESGSEDFEEISKQIRKTADIAYIQGEKVIVDFINGNQLRDFQSQWQENILHRLCLCKNERTDLAINNIRKSQELQTLNTPMKHKIFLLQLNREANLLAERVKNGTMKDKDLEDKFEEMWIHWVNQYRPRKQSQPIVMEDIVKSKLYDLFHASKHVLDDELKRFPLKEPVVTNASLGIIVTDRIRKYVHSGLQSNHIIFASHQEEEVHVTDVIRKTDMFFDDLKKKDIQFDPTYVNKLLRIVIDENTKSSVNDVSVIISVHVCRYALPVFKHMNDRFEERHSVQSYTDTFKKSAHRFFINVVKTREEDGKAASLFCELLNIVLTQEIVSKVQQSIERDIMETFSHSKQEVVGFIMKKLLSPESKFESFQRYIDDPYTFTYISIDDHTDRYMFDTNRTNTSTEYFKQAKRYLDKTFTSLHRIIDRVTNSVTSFGAEGHIDAWVDEFTQHCDILPLPQSFFKLVKDRDVSKLRSFQELVCRELDLKKKDLLSSSEKVTSANIVWKNGTPCKNIMDRLWGCVETCPFCHEPCIQKDKNHISKGIRHSCERHKPLCVRRINFKDRKYAFYVCNQLITTNQTFKCDDCDYECRKEGVCKGRGAKSVSHKYNEYREIFPSWNIEPNIKEAMLEYWKWFIGTFSYQLKTVLGAEIPNIPSDWKKLSRKDANDSIPHTEIINRVSTV